MTLTNLIKQGRVLGSLAMKYVILPLLLAVSCSTPRPKGATEAEVLYQEAKQLAEDKHYLLAVEKINIIRSKYPYSLYSTRAQLLNADILYEQKNYTEAVAAYIVFKDFHPRYERAPYVLYRIAESFYRQLPSTYDRDLSPAFEAIKYYRELMRVYPSSKYAAKSQKKVQKSLNMIEDKEKYIADFYFKTEDYRSARHRYLSILENFALNKRTRDHAAIRVLAASRALEDKASCEKYYKKYAKLIRETYQKRFKKTYLRCVESS